MNREIPAPSAQPDSKEIQKRKRARRGGALGQLAAGELRRPARGPTATCSLGRGGKSGLHNGALGRNVPLRVEASSKPGKLEQVKPDLRLLEDDKGLEDVVPYVFPSFKLGAAQLVASTAAGLGRGGGRWQRCNFSK